MDKKKVKPSINQESIAPVEILPNLDPNGYRYLSYLAILNEEINREDILTFLEICGCVLTEEELSDFVKAGIDTKALVSTTRGGELPQFYAVEQRIRKYFTTNLTEAELKERHNFADQFYRRIFTNAFVATIADENFINDPTFTSEEEVNNMFIRPGGFIDFGAHYPQAPNFHMWSLQRAFYWQDHLFELKRFEEASNITNSICFALARRGHSRVAKEMLARNTMVTSGLYKAVSLTNLATLLREQQEHQQAMALYKQLLWPLIRFKAIPQLAAVFSEMSNIYRDRGRLFRALVFQGLSKILRLFLKDLKGQAICNNQLSILYRSLRFYRLALKASKSAESYWRSVEDEVNLAKTLLTQGNLFNIMGKPDKALRRFNESLEINNRIENLAEAASSTSGKARAHIQLRDFTQANVLLKEAIALRQRSGDHQIGIEYENMGVLYQEQGNLPVALRWYEKALPYLEKYQPGHAYSCKRKIVFIQKQLK